MNSGRRKRLIVMIALAAMSVAACVKYLSKQDPYYIVLAVFTCLLFAWVSSVKPK